MLGLNSAISVCRPPNFFLEGARFTKIFENLKIFEKFLLINAIKMIFGDLLKKLFLNFSTKSDVFDCKTSFLS